MKLQAASGYVIVTDGEDETAININHIVTIRKNSEDSYRIDMTDGTWDNLELPLGLILAAIRTAKSMTGAGLMLIPDAL